MLPALISLRELCASLDVSGRTIRRWVSLGSFPPPMRLGGALRWREDAVSRWLESQAHRAGPRRIPGSGLDGLDPPRQIRA